MKKTQEANHDDWDSPQGWNQIARQDSVTNTRISHVNTMIALETKRESAQMRSIALLTMIYLPLSCVAVGDGLVEIPPLL